MNDAIDFIPEYAALHRPSDAQRIVVRTSAGSDGLWLTVKIWRGSDPVPVSTESKLCADPSDAHLRFANLLGGLHQSGFFDDASSDLPFIGAPGGQGRPA